jgi:hypothetical protein
LSLQLNLSRFTGRVITKMLFSDAKVPRLALPLRSSFLCVVKRLVFFPWNVLVSDPKTQSGAENSSGPQTWKYGFRFRDTPTLCLKYCRQTSRNKHTLLNRSGELADRLPLPVLWIKAHFPVRFASPASPLRHAASAIPQRHHWNDQNWFEPFPKTPAVCPNWCALSRNSHAGGVKVPRSLATCYERFHRH